MALLQQGHCVFIERTSHTAHTSPNLAAKSLNAYSASTHAATKTVTKGVYRVAYTGV